LRRRSEANGYHWPSVFDNGYFAVAERRKLLKGGFKAAQQMLLIGDAGELFIGFFLPWICIDNIDRHGCLHIDH
jgi:hypothetical protein